MLMASFMSTVLRGFRHRRARSSDPLKHPIHCIDSDLARIVRHTVWSEGVGDNSRHCLRTDLELGKMRFETDVPHEHGQTLTRAIDRRGAEEAHDLAKSPMHE